MALTLDPATKVITIPQADLTLISGNLFELDTDQFRKDVFDLLASEEFIFLPDAYRHNTEVTVAGTTFARTLEFINGFSITFENLLYSVRLAGSNNNLFDVENGVLNPSGNVTVISQNSAGLISTERTVTAGDIQAIEDAVFTRVIENGETFEQAMKLVRANAAGAIVKAGDNHKVKSADGLKDRIDAEADENGRTINSTDVT